jgi:hypothetical protein
MFPLDGMDFDPESYHWPNHTMAEKEVDGQFSTGANF